MKLHKLSLLPHEVFFGLFLIITWIRLCLARGPFDPDALLYFGMIAVNVWLVCMRSDAPWAWRSRLLFYPVAMNLVFFNMKQAIPKIAATAKDPLLHQIDAWLLGGDLSLRLQSFVHPAATEFFSFCYLLFFPYLIVSLLTSICGRLDLAKRFFSGLFTIYGLGFLGYSLLPAAGPWSALGHEFTVPLTGGWLTALNAAVVARGSNGVDVFPSLHCAVSAYILLFDYQHRRWLFWCCLVPCVGLWCSTLYLRYHYSIDVIAGFALAGLGLWIARHRPMLQEDFRLEARELDRDPKPIPYEIHTPVH